MDNNPPDDWLSAWQYDPFGIEQEFDNPYFFNPTIEIVERHDIDDSNDKLWPEPMNGGTCYQQERVDMDEQQWQSEFCYSHYLNDEQLHGNNMSTEHTQPDQLTLLDDGTVWMLDPSLQGPSHQERQGDLESECPIPVQDTNAELVGVSSASHEAIELYNPLEAGLDTISAKVITKQPRTVLEEWTQANPKILYPSSKTKKLLASAIGWSIKQVSTWFNNHRQRVWKPLHQVADFLYVQKPMADSNDGFCEVMALGTKQNPDDDAQLPMTIVHASKTSSAASTSQANLNVSSCVPCYRTSTTDAIHELILSYSKHSDLNVIIDAHQSLHRALIKNSTRECRCTLKFLSDSIWLVVQAFIALLCLKRAGRTSVYSARLAVADLVRLYNQAFVWYPIFFKRSGPLSPSRIQRKRVRSHSARSERSFDEAESVNEAPEAPPDAYRHSILPRGSRRGCRIPHYVVGNSSNKSSVDVPRKISCHWCHQTFTRKSSLKRHYQSVHYTETIWVCQPVTKTEVSTRSRSAGTFSNVLECLCGKDEFDCGHEMMDCWIKDQTERTFFRLDNFRRHLRETHKLGDLVTGLNMNHFKSGIDQED